MNCIKKYFPLGKKQEKLLSAYQELLKHWNEKINLISRKDIDNLCIRHFLHSLSIAKIIDLSNTKVIDVGTGGGLPGIPLAIFFPKAEFLLIDSIEKKIFALQNIIENLGLTNVKALKIRSKELKQKFDFVVARAVAEFPKFIKDTKHLIEKGQKTNLPNGFIYLKGGDLKNETAPFAGKIKIWNLNDFFSEDFFETKKILFLPKN